MTRKLSVPEAAEWLGVSAAAVRVAIHEGRITVERNGRRVAIAVEELERYVARRASRLLTKDACAQLAALDQRPHGVDELDWHMLVAYAAPGVSLRDIAERHGVTRQRVRQRIQRALRGAPDVELVAQSSSARPQTSTSTADS